jgi:hypothetical protein
MDKIGPLDRWMLGRAFTILLNLTTLAVVGPLTVRAALDWAAQIRNEPEAAEGDPVHRLTERQASVGILLVALGVVLEGRHTFVRRVLKVHGLAHLPGQEEFTEHCELFGFYVLVVGLLIECCGELTKYLDLHQRPALLAFGGVSLVLNAVAIGCQVRLIGKVARLKLPPGEARRTRG